MGKKRKKRAPEGASSTSDRRGAFAFKPFEGLKLDSDEARSTREKTQPPPRRHEEETPEGPDNEPDEAEILSRMMDGAKPLERDRETFDASREISEGPPRMSDAELVMRHLDDLVYGNTPFELADTDEYIEASVKGLDRRIVKKLRRGEFSVQAHLDLHGYRREEARVEVADFVERAALAGKRCVLIVHGRGMRSKDNIPVLKEKLTSWLTRGAMSRRVLAFTSAKPWDGGVGAVYVLLRG